MSKRKLAPLRKASSSSSSKVEAKVDGGETSKLLTEAISGVNMKKLMNDDGPVVKCVLLLSSGKSKELELDMSPRLKKVHETLKGSVTFLGQWETIECMLVLNESLQTKGKASSRNKHCLQPPFNDATVFGDILVTRSDENGLPVDFTLAEYENFTKLDIEPWVEEVVDEDEDDEEEEEEDEDEDEDEEADLEAEFMEVLKEKLVNGFKEQNGRMPNKKELEGLMASLSARMGGDDAEGDEEDDENDDESEEDEPVPVPATKKTKRKR